MGRGVEGRHLEARAARRLPQGPRRAAGRSGEFRKAMAVAEWDTLDVGVKETHQPTGPHHILGPSYTRDQVPALPRLPPQGRAQKPSRDVSRPVRRHSLGRGTDTGEAMSASWPAASGEGTWADGRLRPLRPGAEEAGEGG